MNRRNLLKSIFYIPLAALGMNKTLAALAAPAKDDDRTLFDIPAKMKDRASKTATGTAELNRIANECYDNIVLGLNPVYVRKRCVNDKCDRLDLHEAPVMCKTKITNIWFG